MNNLVFLSEVKKENKYGNLSLGKQIAQSRYKFRLEERINRSRAIIKNELDRYNNESKKEIENNEIKQIITDLKIKYNEENDSIIKINNILKILFTLNNSIPLVNLLNSIYNENLSESTKIKYIVDEKYSSTDDSKLIYKGDTFSIQILANDKNRQLKYRIQFEDNYDKNTAIQIFKYDFVQQCNQNISKKIEENKQDKLYIKGTRINIDNPYMILIDSKISIPDVYESKIFINNEYFNLKFNVIKSWKYDLKQLYEQKLYLLLPLKVFDLKKRLLSIKSQTEELLQQKNASLYNKIRLENLIKDEICRFFRDINIYFNKLKMDGIINRKDIKKLNYITVNLLKFFNNEYSYTNINIEQEIECILDEF